MGVISSYWYIFVGIWQIAIQASVKNANLGTVGLPKENAVSIQPFVTSYID